MASSFGVKLSVVEAGPVTGRFVEQSFGVGADDHSAPFVEMWECFGQMVDKGYERAQTPEDVADVIAAVIDEEDPHLRYQTLRAVTRMVELKVADMTGERVTASTSSWIA